jgi:ppGpp synthetase/RelA/SpoT-type nucleotidyltranferase
LRKKQRNNILISFFKEKEKYKKLAEYVVGFIRDDPSAPKECIHTILYRIKDEERLIEKIDQENIVYRDNLKSITDKNFQELIGDIIGIRIICLRLSDIVKVETYLELLVEEKIFQLLREPDHKRSFVLPIDPSETVPQNFNPRYSGYSSIHYQIKLGENSDSSEEFKRLHIELQLRTILEEAWGEIDHKYRYAYSRIGDILPEHIHSGFYNLSAYLQAAAMQAEQLCREVDSHRLSMPLHSKKKKRSLESSDFAINNSPHSLVNQLTIHPGLKLVLEEKFGFKPTARTLTYIVKRFGKLGYSQRSKSFFQKMFNSKRLKDFRALYQKVLKQDPFEDSSNRDVDLINAVNFALFDEIEGARVAREGLISTLKWRKERSSL